MTRVSIKWFWLFSAFVSLTACAPLVDREALEERLGAKQSRAESMVKSVGKVDKQEEKSSPVAVEKGAWIVSKPFRISPVANLPRSFYEDVVFNRQVTSLQEFASRITAITGIPAVPFQDAIRASATVIASGGVRSPGGGAGPLPAPGPVPGGGAEGPSLRVAYQGSLKGLLDTVSSRLGIYWEYDADRIKFFVANTRVFALKAVSGDLNMTATVSSAGASASGGGGGTSGSTSQNIQTSSKLAIWDDISKTVKSMLSPTGQVTASLGTGTIVVTDAPDVLDRVGQFIDEANRELSRQLTVDVNLYVVTLDDSDAYGLDWNVVSTKLSQYLAYPVKSTTVGIGVPTPTSGTLTLSILANNGSLAEGSQMVFQALSSAGLTRRATTASVIATNNQPVPVQVATQTAYISQSQQTTVTGGTTPYPQTTMTTSSVTTGFNLVLLPRIMPDNTILLQFSMDLSTLTNLRSFATSTSKVEMPEIETRNFLQRVSLMSGETLIVAGFEELKDSKNRSGVGSADNLLFGNRKGTGSRNVLVVTITPVEIPARI